MRKLIISLLCVLLLSGTALAAENTYKFKQGVLQYKKGNYIGCMITMKDIISKDPGNSLAHYYLAISYVQVGKKELAIKEYNNVISLNPGTQLAIYAQQGLKHLEAAPPSQNPSAPPSAQPIGSPMQSPPAQLPELKGISSGNDDFMTEKAKDTIREKSLNQVINNANQNNPIDPEKFKKFEDFSKKKSEAPTQEEIAQAMQTLSKAGMNQAINPEMMQMNMLMSSMGGFNSGMNSGFNNSMNMMPLMMMYQNSNNGKNIDPQIMQNMITSMMMPGMYSLTNTGNNENNF